MAKAKKKERLSLEERLEQAIVPVDEQPYEVPENWCWTRLQYINQFKSKTIDPMKNLEEIFELYSVPSSEFDYPEVLKGSEIGSSKQCVEKNDVLLCKINPRTNRVWFVEKHTDNCLIASSEWIVVRNKMLNEKYLMWCMRAKYFREYMLSNVSGVGGSLMRAQPKYVINYPIPIPPLAEQQRIVKQIESLFAKLDEVKERINMCLSVSYERRTLIFNKAFSGELTEAWRKERNVSNEWKTLRLEQMCEKITDGTHHSPTNTDEGDYMYVTAKNIKVTGLDLSHITYVSKAVHEEIYSRCDVKKGDVLYIKDGATTGIATVNTLEEQFSLLSSVAVLRPNDNVVLSEYLCFSLNSEKVKSMMIKNMSGSAITRLTLSKIKKAELAVCSINEQCEIVKILKDVSMKEDMIEQVCNDVIIKIDVMKKSILAKAFRGELGTNNPDEESAVELLKSILEQEE